MRLSHHYVVPHISTGDMLRAAVKTGSALGLKVKETMDSGELLGDDLIMEMVAERLAEPDARARGFILDGCPRTTHQAEVLAALLAPDDLDAAVDIEVPTAQALRRLAGRRVCIDCGANYSVSAPPKVNWICDVCGGEVIQREDDTEEAIRPPARALRAPDGAAHRLVRVAGAAGQGERRRARPTPCCAGSSGPSRSAAGPEARVPMRRSPMRRRGDRQDAPGRTGGGRDARGHPGGGQAGRDHGRARRRGPRRPRPPGRQVQLPALPGVPGGDLHLAQRHDRPRHPRAATSSQEGDIISIDCGAIIEGYHGDAAFTMAIGEVLGRGRPPDRGRPSAACGPGSSSCAAGTASTRWAGPSRTVAEGAGFSVVREYVGHAIGTAMHEEPQVPELLARPAAGPMLKAGMVFAVEPMVNAGGPGTRVLDDGWSVVTADGSLSAHFEHTIAVTDDGPEVLTLP